MEASACRDTSILGFWKYFRVTRKEVPAPHIEKMLREGQSAHRPLRFFFIKALRKPWILEDTFYPPAGMPVTALTHRRKLLPICFQLLGGPTGTNESSDEVQRPESWRRPCCGGAMVVIERLTGVQLTASSSPIGFSTAA